MRGRCCLSSKFFDRSLRLCASGEVCVMSADKHIEHSFGSPSRRHISDLLGDAQFLHARPVRDYFSYCKGNYRWCGSLQHASPLRELTCHTGSDSVICTHPAEVTFPPLPHPKLALDLATPGVLVGRLHDTEMVYPLADIRPSQY